MSAPLVAIQNLTKLFVPHQNPAVKGINVEIPKGKIVGLAGPDGAGKTTLIRLIGGLLTPSEGNVSIAGLDVIRHPEEVRALTSYMPQKFGLYEDLTVAQNLNLYADLRQVSGEERM